MGNGLSLKRSREPGRFETKDHGYVSAEYWIVLIPETSGKQYNLYARVGTLINAVEDSFGYSPESTPEYQVWHIDLIHEKVSIVGAPTWRPKL